MAGSEFFSCIHTKSQLAPLYFSIGKIDKFGHFLKIICSYCECTTFIAHALDQDWCL